MNRLRASYLLAFAVVVCLIGAGLWSVGRSSEQRRLAFSAGYEPGALRVASTQAPRAGDAQPPTSRSPVESVEAMDASRQLLRNATLSIETGHYAEAAERAAAIVAAHGGFLADAKSSRGDDGQERGTLTLRVPAPRFDRAFHELKTLGRVDSASVETQDVTRQYADLEARLSAKRDAEARLREILKKKTSGLSELVAAEQERTRLIEEIERLEGDRRYLQRRVAYATIVVELREPSAFLRAHALSPLLEALRGALPLLAGSVGALISVTAAALPWVAIALLFWILRRRFATRRLIRIATQD
jgi:Domain of unknown function (DUF4349)